MYCFIALLYKRVLVLLKVLGQLKFSVGDNEKTQWVVTQCVLGSDIASGRIPANEDVW